MKIALNLKKLRCSLLPALLTTLIAAPALGADYMAAEPLKKKVSLDGMLREWPRGFDKLKTKSGGSTSNRSLVGYDSKYIYLAAKLKDKKLVRTKAGGSGEDQLILELRVPQSSGRSMSYKVQVFPGQPGKLPGLVKVNGKRVSGAKAVEAPSSGGFTLEARIPWSALPATKSVRVGMQGRVSYHDASSVGRIQSITSTSFQSGSSLPPLTLAPETGLIQALLEPQGLGLKPARVAYGDLTGKGGLERVALYGTYLSIVGPGYKGGKSFYYNELDIASAKSLLELSLLDFNGDGKSEIVLRKRLGGDDKYREVIQVLALGADGAPLQVFIHETAIVTDEGKIQNKVSVQGSGKSASIEISQGKATGFEPGSYREPSLSADIPSALLPWQSIKSRSFTWKGAGLALNSEKTWEPKISGQPPASTAPGVPAPPAPRPPSADEMLERVYALYQNDRGVRRGQKPSFDFVTDVVEDKQMERVVIHDRDLLVFGKGFKKGLSYTYLTIGVKESKDILSVTTRDLVGDGKAEIIVHAVLNAKASESLGGKVVGRQALFVYKVIGEQLTRIFAAETARSLDGNRILAGLAFLPGSQGVSLELRPLRALGWTESSYPFPEDHLPAGGLEPLLLPWGTVGTRRYEFDGSRYVLQ